MDGEVSDRDEVVLRDDMVSNRVKDKEVFNRDMEVSDHGEWVSDRDEVAFKG